MERSPRCNEWGAQTDAGIASAATDAAGPYSGSGDLRCQPDCASAPTRLWTLASFDRLLVYRRSVKLDPVTRVTGLPSVWSTSAAYWIRQHSVSWYRSCDRNGAERS